LWLAVQEGAGRPHRVKRMSVHTYSGPMPIGAGDRDPKADVGTRTVEAIP
jgi:hypothetical protein